MENTQENKTPEQWFQQLKEPYRSEAIENIDVSHYDYKDLQESLYDSLMDSFRWSSTKQNHDYWRDIYESIKSGETTYIETQQVDNTDNLKPEQMESGKWYFLKTHDFEWFIKFLKIEKSSICIEKVVEKDKPNSRFTKKLNHCDISVVELIRPATKEEVLKYFPDEVFEPTDWKAKFEELQKRYDELLSRQNNQGEKVYFFSDIEEKIWGKVTDKNLAIEFSRDNYEIYEAVCIGKKKSVLVNETT